MADFRVMLPLAAALVDIVLKNGEYKHGNTWVTQLITTHIEHALEHIKRHMAGEIYDGNTNETHLSHAVTRLMMALELQLRELELEKREARRRARCKAKA